MIAPIKNTLPFSIIVDTREQMPYHFNGIYPDQFPKRKPNPANPDDDGKPHPYIVPLITDMALRSGDYSISGYEDKIAVERKSVADFYGSIGGGRERFQREVERLDAFEFAAVVIEGSWHELLNLPPTSTQVTPKMASRTILSWSIRYPRVHWFTCMHRRHSELVTFRLLERFWKLKQEEKKEAAKNGV